MPQPVHLNITIIDFFFFFLAYFFSHLLGAKTVGLEGGGVVTDLQFHYYS